jgi:MFS transporter, DHA3 family, multidrug efflux protein
MTKLFYAVLANSLVASVTNTFVWFAVTFWVYLETKSGLIGLIVTLISMRSSSYKLMSANYEQQSAEDAGMMPTT